MRSVKINVPKPERLRCNLQKRLVLLASMLTGSLRKKMGLLIKPLFR